MPVTLQDIAVAAEVSAPTVSRVLNGTFRSIGISHSSAERIRKIARQMGYRPNAAARAVRSGRFAQVALLVGTEGMRSRIFAGLLAGIHEGIAEDRLNLMLVRMPDELLTDLTVMPRALEEAASDGFLVDYTHGIPDRMIQLIRSFRIPAVWINSKQDFDCVRPDDLSAGRDATGQLLSLGHRRVAYANYTYGPGFPQPHYSVAERQAGYEQAMRAAGLTPRVLRATEGYDVVATKRVAFSRRWLGGPDRPTGVVCYGGSEAQPIFHAATCMGLAMPGDLSLTMFGEAPIKWFGPLLSAWLTPDREVGREATRMLLEKIRRPERKLASRTVPFNFFEHGATCAPPRSGGDGPP